MIYNKKETAEQNLLKIIVCEKCNGAFKPQSRKEWTLHSDDGSLVYEIECPNCKRTISMYLS
jgi:RNase P subunit RPR2